MKKRVKVLIGGNFNARTEKEEANGEGREESGGKKKRSRDV